MPCYLFTLHGKLTWMPDHRRGYVRRGVGILQPDPVAAEQYRRRADGPGVEFDERIQRIILDALLDACSLQRCRLHAVFFEPTHVHFLVSWRIARG